MFMPTPVCDSHVTLSHWFSCPNPWLTCASFYPVT